ncbi:hypothetical protein BOV90_01385 [Solemya velum gill symbiont]|uniref:Uncharacterized protein n=1 Tax=Solemya velum gill symbiont TaxID=2340 RepID=A0A1T2DY36_SOVGS|nr:hypothetical protein BOV88_03765 [Solemya velum gill symbiont]OOY38392.1 hypothetical protein BOV89_03030 [Solemya velum gill symbiont]OOY40990.1 hypothetical protein BOV90_01385 [Solemya velum gill symbiont]OOY42994.1 hypothetical protein BOV91_05275 [Solemya velum gill symbiont]OOY51954.1 hypothetical protein BOV94_04065 [Solemya velum gill symbiont]
MSVENSISSKFVYLSWHVYIYHAQKQTKNQFTKWTFQIQACFKNGPHKKLKAEKKVLKIRRGRCVIMI